MAKYKIKATYNYEGVVEALTIGKAESLFEHNLQQYYESLESFEIESVCDNCEGELDLDGSCFECRDDEEEVEDNYGIDGEIQDEPESESTGLLGKNHNRVGEMYGDND